MKAEHLYRGGMLFLSLALMAASADVFFPEAEKDLDALTFILLALAFALFNFHSSSAGKQSR